MVDKHQKLKLLSDFTARCKRCELGCNFIAIGDKDVDPHIRPYFDLASHISQYVIVCPSPSISDDGVRIPMRGDTQRLFDEALDNKWGSWIRLSRDSFYITHVRKCLSTVNNLEHTKICSTIFDGEIKIIQPRLIIAMGEESFEFLCPNCDYKSALGKITKSRYGNVYTTYYPAGTDLLDNEVIETFKKHIALISRLIWESECPF